MAKKKRKLSKFNLFMRSKVKGGMTFKQAAKSWKSGSKTTRRKVRTRAITKTRKRSGRVMARRRRRSVGVRARGGFNFMKGIIPIRGILASAAIGVGASMVAAKFAPQVIPQQNLIVAGATGGIPGAVAAFLIQGAGFGVGNGSAGTAFF